MRSISAIRLPVLLIICGLIRPESAAAQSGSSVEDAVGDSLPAAVAPPAKEKKKGMFGKVKGLAKNKIVKTIGKAALCTVVPGGQVIAGALDAAETKDVAGAAVTAATGGGSCMPGMAGTAGAAAPAAGIGGAAAGALGAGISGAAVPGQPSTGMPAMAMSPEQLKQMQEQYGKMGMDTAQLRAMQQMMSGMPGAAAPAASESGPAVEPASGAPALSREKGRMLVRNLPWLSGGAGLREGGEPMFGMAMREVALTIQATEKRYKIEARVEDQGGKTQNRLLSQKRAAAVVAALTAQGISSERLAVTDGKSDKDARIIVSEGK